MKAGLFIVLSIINITISQVRIAGEQDGVFDSANYIVSKDIIVPAEKSLKFLPGSEISFLPYTGLRVYGNLIINGSKLNSLDDHGGLWNGIEIAPKGSINFENVIISRSVFGIAAADSTVINALEKIKFNQNKISLKIADKTVFIRDDEPYSFEKATTDRSVQTGNIPSNARGMNRTRLSILALRWGTSIAAITCSALWAHYMESSEHFKTKYTYAGTTDEAKNFRSQSEDSRQYGILSGIGAIIFSAGLFITISINGCSK